MDEMQLGELIGTVRAIKQNTDKIPDMATKIALQEAIIMDMKPKVERHESSAQRAVGVAAIFGILSGFVTKLFNFPPHIG